MVATDVPSTLNNSCLKLCDGRHDSWPGFNWTRRLRLSTYPIVIRLARAYAELVSP